MSHFCVIWSVLFCFTFPKQLNMKGKVECFVCVGVRIGSFEDMGADVELGIELSPRTPFL